VTKESASRSLSMSDPAEFTVWGILETRVQYYGSVCSVPAI
jgi:hypothetical protein